MNTRLHSTYFHLFLVWLILFSVMAYMTLQSTEWAPSKPVPKKPLPVAVSEPVPAPVPVPVVEKPAPAPELPLLPQGRKQGSGSLGTPVAHWDSAAQRFTLTVPYQGTLGEYTDFLFDRVVSACFDLHGTWTTRAQTIQVRGKQAGCPVQLIQTGQHGTFVRFSLVGRALPRRLIRYSPTELLIIMEADTAPAAQAARTAAPAQAAPAARTAGQPAQAAPAGDRAPNPNIPAASGQAGNQAGQAGQAAR